MLEQVWDMVEGYKGRVYYQPFESGSQGVKPLGGEPGLSAQTADMSHSRTFDEQTDERIHLAPASASPATSHTLFPNLQESVKSQISPVEQPQPENTYLQEEDQESPHVERAGEEQSTESKGKQSSENAGTLKKESDLDHSDNDLLDEYDGISPDTGIKLSIISPGLWRRMQRRQEKKRKQLSRKRLTRQEPHERQGGNDH